MAFMLLTPAPVGSFERIQAGLRNGSAGCCTLMGMRESLSAPRWWLSGFWREGAWYLFMCFIVWSSKDRALNRDSPLEVFSHGIHEKTQNMRDLLLCGDSNAGLISEA